MTSFYGLGALKGLIVTLRYLFRKPFTVEYPDEKLVPNPRFRGNSFVWYEDRCTGNGACAKACPLGIIRIVTHPTSRPDIGNLYAIDRFDIDTGRCMFCALCIEACPYDAVFMGNDFERATKTRDGLVIHKEDLVTGAKLPTQQFRPQLEAMEYKGEEELDQHEAGRWSL
ncbi:MAG: NADH-quinone oxidoreductase subunit I [SAR202 cluster bacterium]|nr:NADH-quinone oxidoreductase subunit I [SAR202 cluster bacterium]|tara:strand:- start:767 stop:1276 length:510 start_codon:yes stop_codon:yes gene_type:complete